MKAEQRFQPWGQDSVNPVTSRSWKEASEALGGNTTLMTTMTSDLCALELRETTFPSSSATEFVVIGTVPTGSSSGGKYHESHFIDQETEEKW